ncbi:hypothetical protein Q5752_005881 [Cryptotrichosporon argae]
MRRDDMMADYNVRPSKIKLKATPEEMAERIYRREQRRAHRQQVRIERANRRAARCTGTPELASRTVSPPRRPVPLDEEDGAYGPVPPARVEEEWEEEAAWLVSSSNPFAAYDTYDAPRVPARYATAGLGGDHGHGHGVQHRQARAEVAFSGGPVPPLGSMSEAEYTEFVRAGMDGLRAARAERDEAARRAARAERERAEWAAEKERMKREEERAERRRRRRRDEEREREREREEREREQWRGLEEEADGRRAERDYRAGNVPTSGGVLRAERARWRARAKALMLGEQDDVVALELGWGDVPWPVQGRARGTGDIDRERVGAFMRALARDDAEADGGDGDEARALKKALREAIRVYHPDRFYARVLPRVKEDARDVVKEGVELCSRIINELAAK